MYQEECQEYQKEKKNILKNNVFTPAPARTDSSILSSLQNNLTTSTNISEPPDAFRNPDARTLSGSTNKPTGVPVRGLVHEQEALGTAGKINIFKI